MKLPHKKLLAASIAFSLVLPSVASATNGYFLIGYGTKSRGMGGVGVAYAQDGLAAAYNPAGMIDLDDRFDVGGDLFMPERAVYHNSSALPADAKSHGDFFPIPAMGGILKYSDDITLGFAIVGAGLGTDYDQPVSATQPSNLFNFNGNSSNQAGVRLYQMQMLPSIAYKISDTHSVGVSLAVAMQTFRSEGLQSFEQSVLGYTAGQGGTSNEGWDWSFGGGFRIGWLGKFMNGDLQLGANYSSRVYMSRFREYDNLFAEQGDFDIPPITTIGLSYRAIPNFNIAFDVQYVQYEDIASIANKGPVNSDPVSFFPENTGVLGLDNGMGFGWVNQTVYKLGVDYAVTPTLTVRAGLNYGETPIPDDQILFNMLAPATVERHITFGATYQYASDIELSMSYMHAFKETITGKTVFYPDGVDNFEDLTEDNAAISMSQNAIGFGVGIKF